MQPTRLDAGPHPSGDGFCLIEAASEVGGFGGGDNPPQIAGFVRILGRRLNDAVDDEVRQTFLPYVDAVAGARRDEAYYADRALTWVFKEPMTALMSESCGADVAMSASHFLRRQKELREVERLPQNDKGRAKKLKAAKDNFEAAIDEIRELVQTEATLVELDEGADPKIREKAQASLVRAGQVCGVEIDPEVARPESSRREVTFHLAGLSHVSSSPLLSTTAIVGVATHPSAIEAHPPSSLLKAILG